MGRRSWLETFSSKGRETAVIRPGDRFGNFTVLRRTRGSTTWLCRCDCGVEIERSTFSLQRPVHPMCQACRKASRRWKVPGDYSYV